MPQNLEFQDDKTYTTTADGASCSLYGYALNQQIRGSNNGTANNNGKDGYGIWPQCTGTYWKQGKTSITTSGLTPTCLYPTEYKYRNSSGNWDGY